MFEACRTVQSIFRGFRVSIDERGLSMDSRFLNELRNLMAEDDALKSEKTKLTFPTVFIGGAEEVRQLHETGELKKIIFIIREDLGFSLSTDLLVFSRF
ncbi:putative glutaredoxin, Thioredoxin-like superfamily [Helianthus anomalus]